jgi:hypothetical protein
MADDTLAKIQALKAELKKLEAELAGPDRLKLAAEGLAGAAAELETTHPKIAAALAEICRELSSLGI